MSKARIAFLSVPGIDRVLATLRSDGWTLDDGSTAHGASVVASYPGGLPRSAVERIASELDAVGVDYVAVIGSAFDAAMDGPSPAQIDVSSRWRLEGRPLRIPSRTTVPGIDVRTLVAAGMDHSEAVACIASIGGAASGSVAGGSAGGALAA